VRQDRRPLTRHLCTSCHHRLYRDTWRSSGYQQDSHRRRGENGRSQTDPEGRHQVRRRRALALSITSLFHTERSRIRGLLSWRPTTRCVGMHQRIRETDLGDSKGTRGGEEKCERANDGKDPEWRTNPDEECPMVPRQGELQRNERQGCGKLLFLSQLPETRQPCQIPDRNDERTTRGTRMGQTPITVREGLGTGTPTAREDDRSRQAAAIVQ